MTVGERIKEVRTKLGMSQVDFADKINVSKQTLYKYENNIITNIPSDKVEAAARIGNISPAYLMGWDEQWDKKSKQFEDKINAFFLQLRGLGWSYKWLDSEKKYLLSNGTTSIKITAEEYGNLVDSSEDFCRHQLQKLLLKSSSLLLSNQQMEDELLAAHARTDVKATPEDIQHDIDIMDDDSKWD